MVSVLLSRAGRLLSTLSSVWVWALWVTYNDEFSISVMVLVMQQKSFSESMYPMVETGESQLVAQDQRCGVVCKT